MRVLLWHVHGGWMEAFVRGAHEYLIPATPARDAWGLGRGGRDWPAAAQEVHPDRLADADVDVVVAQRPEELGLARELLGRSVPVVFVEHNTPKGDVPNARHPLADREDVLLVHVTHVNRLLWDTGSTRTVVIEHGVPDPGQRYTGGLPRLAAVINEPVRRGRVTGTDLLPAFAAAGRIDLFGMGTDAVHLGPEVVPSGDLPTEMLHTELARRRVYLHPLRWTSLGLSLLEAMHLGMPVVALGMTEAFRAVPPEAGAISSDVDELVRAARRLLEDPAEAAARGRVARAVALERYGLPRFLADWDTVLDDARTAHPAHLERSSR